MNADDKKQVWKADQLTKSEFFHQKLHEWGLVEVAAEIDVLKGEILEWEITNLGISSSAWNKVVHRGIKPIISFAHPAVLTQISRSTGYYRMLAMVSQKSMNQVGLSSKRYEDGRVPEPEIALALARHLNGILSVLIEADEMLDAREFDLWRGMAAGSQAQGSWQNTKGKKAEIVIQGVFRRRLQQENLIKGDEVTENRLPLTDGRVVVFADEPDIAVYRQDKIVAAVEVKGGIDKAGALERVGAALKSLSHSKEENPDVVTALIMQDISMTTRARTDLQSNRDTINHWFTVEQVLGNETIRNKLFRHLAL